MANLIEMPKLSDTMSVGTLVTWLKKEGDEVSTGDMIAEVETDKATMEVECFDDGVLLKHYVQEGEEVEIGHPICAVGEKGESPPEVESSSKPDKEEKKEETAKEEKPGDEDTAEDESGSEEDEKEPEESSEKPDAPKGEEDKKDDAPESKKKSTEKESPEETESGRIKASPLARKIAGEMGVDLGSIKGSGPGGRIVKADVVKAEKTQSASKDISTPAATPAPGASLGEDVELPVSNMRATIARALVKSKTEAPHFYLQMEIDAEPLTRFREGLNRELEELPPEQGGAKFSVNDLILKASAEAVRRVPQINRSWQQDKMIQYGTVHLGFAVAIDDGLVTPVIRNAETKSLRAISREARELAQRAKKRKLKLDEMQNSTLTVSNLGMFGISDFYGIINPPNAAILSVGTSIKTPVVNENDDIVPGYRLKIGLSGDHRAIDGAVGALYLQALRRILETPGTMLV